MADEAVTILYLAGEIDMNTNAQLKDALVGLLEQRTANIVIDLSGVEFCGISGFALLVDAARAVEADGRHVAIVAPSPQLTRTWALLWPDRSIPRHHTVAAATAVIRAR